MKFINIYYFLTIVIFSYKIISVITSIDFSKALGYKELLRNHKVDVVILLETIDEVLILHPIILELEKKNIKSFIGIYDSKAEEILKKKLLDSSMISFKKYKNIQDTLYSLYKYRPKVLLISSNFSNYIFFLFSKMLGIKIITVESNYSIKKKNFFYKKLSNVHYSITDQNHNNNISNIKILNSSNYLSNNLCPKNKNLNLTLIISDKKDNMNYIMQLFTDEICANQKFILIVPLNIKFEIINLLKMHKLNFFLWNEEPIDYNLILEYFDCIICFNKNSLNYWASISEIAILNESIKNQFNLTLASLAINKCCILTMEKSFNDKINLFKENSILITDENNLKKYIFRNL